MNSSRPHHDTRRLLVRERLSRALGLRDSDQNKLVGEMLERHARDRVSYWLQLALATAIATLGLALGSTGVVIGAMLISPLMTPLVELGMGLAIGSPVLFARSLTRTLGSVLASVFGAAAMTLALPFQQITSEIAARTAPNALDLLIAACCALMAVFTAVRNASDTAAAAAGTAIGISLVPPLCVGGYGLGVGSFATAGGALLLFTANFSAILLVSVVSFLLLGFDRVPVHELEQRAIESGGRVTMLGRWAHVLFGQGRGKWLRWLLPAVVAGAVFVPLRQALQEVSWEVRVRGEIAKILSSSDVASRALQSSIMIERRRVNVRIAIVGSPLDAGRLEESLERRIALLSANEPKVEVVAVPDAATLNQVAHAQRSAPVPAVEEPELLEQLTNGFDQLWPSSAGTLVEWRVSGEDRSALTIQIVHLGPPLGESSRQVLAAALNRTIRGTVHIESVDYPAAPVRADQLDVGFVTELARALEALRTSSALQLCLSMSAKERSKPEPTNQQQQTGNDARRNPADAALQALLDRAPRGRVTTTAGAAWSFQLKTNRCPPPPPEQAPLAPTSASAGTAGSTP